MNSLTALSLTPAAQQWLSQTTSASVLNSFDRACNLINQRDDILALVTSERGLTPFAMRVVSGTPYPFRAMSSASAVRVDPAWLTIDSLQIGFESARVWDPTPNWPEVRRLFVKGPKLLGVLTTMALDVAPRGSLLDLFLRAEAHTTNSFMFERAWRGAMELTAGLRTGSVAQCLAGVKLLAGLGGGLTPAGDDFIVGALLAAWAGLYEGGQEQLGAVIAGAAAPATTLLSAAYLRSAARGESMIHWHDLFGALSRSDAESVSAAIHSLLSIGHTSGADAFAGFIFHHFENPESNATTFSPRASLL